MLRDIQRAFFRAMFQVNPVEALKEEGETLVEAALDIARRFFDKKLENADRDLLVSQAEDELDDLRDVFSAQQWEGAVEQAIRQAVREAHPLLSASSIWDTVFPCPPSPVHSAPTPPANNAAEQA